MSAVGAGAGKVLGKIVGPIMAPLYVSSYLIEHDRPATDSLPRRRTWLVYGILCYFIVLLDSFVHLVSTTPKAEAQAAFASYEEQLFGLQWPPDDEGGAVLDPAFNLYNVLRWLKFSVFFLCALLLLVLLIDDFRASRVSQAATQRSTWRQQQAGYVVIVALYCAALAPSVPDYPAAADLRNILPKCGYRCAARNCSFLLSVTE